MIRIPHGMLQLRSVNASVVAALRAGGELPPGDVPPEELAARAEALVAKLRAERRNHPGLRGLAARLDARVRTTLPEHFDDPHLPPAARAALTRGLHRHNQLVGAYRRFLGILAPYVRAAAERRGAPARCLELACGSGELTLALHRAAARRGVDLTLVGSDLAPSSVAEANARAAGTAVRFEVLDATTLDGLEPGSFDVVFIAQSAHHFGPGQLAQMAAAGARVATTAFVVIDGFRSLSLFPLLAVTNAIAPHLYHDSFITARKLYSEPELQLIGELAAGPERVTVRSSIPGWSVLAIRGGG